MSWLVHQTISMISPIHTQRSLVEGLPESAMVPKQTRPLRVQGPDPYVYKQLSYGEARIRDLKKNIKNKSQLEKSKSKKNQIEKSKKVNKKIKKRSTIDHSSKK